MEKKYINLFLLLTVILQNNIFSMEKFNTLDTETEKKETNLLNIMPELLEKIIHDVVESRIKDWDGNKDFNIIKKEIAKDLASIKLTSQYFSGIIEDKYLKNNKGFDELVIDSIIKTIDRQLQNKILNYEQKRQEKTDRLIELLDKPTSYCSLHKGDYPQVMQLIDDGANINAQDRYGNTVLIKAVEDGRKDIVELLLAKGADINATNNDGATALMLAVRDSYKSMVELLIAKGANINIPDNYNNTTLITATARSCKDIVELLIAAGADINAKNNSGSTALFYATGEYNIMKLLIDKGANVNHENNDGRTVLFYASRDYREDIVELLINNGAYV